jgi:hypothetical protein
VLKLWDHSEMVSRQTFNLFISGSNPDGPTKQLQNKRNHESIFSTSIKTPIKQAKLFGISLMAKQII